MTRPGGLRWVSVELLEPGLAQLPGSSLAGRCPMTTAAPSAVLATIQPVFTDAERVALAGFLAGYRGLTREAYALDLSSSPAGAGPGRWPCSPSAARTSKGSPESWK
jgi:hypothetical protein